MSQNVSLLKYLSNLLYCMAILACTVPNRSLDRSKAEQARQKGNEERSVSQARNTDRVIHHLQNLDVSADLNLWTCPLTTCEER